MTDSLKKAADDEAAGKGHNSKNRDPDFIAQKVKALVVELRPLEKERDAVNDKLKAARRVFKSETGMTQADFNAARRLAEMEDEDQQNEKMFNLRVAFNALCPGKQLNFIDVMDEAAE